jgi:hypothetical protein
MNFINSSLKKIALNVRKLNKSKFRLLKYVMDFSLKKSKTIKQKFSKKKLSNHEGMKSLTKQKIYLT